MQRVLSSYVAAIRDFEQKGYFRIGPLVSAKQARTIRASLYRFKASVWSAVASGDHPCRRPGRPTL